MVSRWKKTIQTASNLTGFVGGTFDLFTHRSLPRKNGTLQLSGLHDTVEIITTPHGIPHIYASNEDDLYLAQGYLHAQDRLWQLEFNRRLGAGRLSEIFGPLTLEIDRFCRRLGMHRAGIAHEAQLSTHSRRILEAYAHGVNAYIETNSHKLPVEFTVLGIKPAPWQVTDIIQWSKVQGWSLSGNWETELIRARLVARLGAERAAQLETGYDPEHPLIIPTGAAYQGINLGLLEQYAQIRELSGFGTLGGSNNWVVDGTMTHTGAPLLCNDPHLNQAAPSIWYQCHLSAGNIDVIGVSFPGAPGVVIGHNQHIAWGVTNAVSDVEDLYLEKLNPEHPHQYEFMGQWEEAQVIQEEIQVKGQPPIIEEVLVTRHGPIITTLSQTSTPSEETQPPLALRWTGLEQSRIIAAVQNINRATNWEEFREALRDWDNPPQNFVYADRKGNIGYLMAGAIPLRAKGLALLPSPGWTGEYEWTGFIPFEELPQAYNPPSHFIVTANNRVVDDNYPYYITHEWVNGYRAQRIRDLLTSKEKLTIADMAEIQQDLYALPAVEIVPYILQIAADTPLKRAAHDILQTWDYLLTPPSIGAAIYTTFLRKLERIVLDVVLGDDENLLQNYQGSGLTNLLVFNGYAARTKPWLLRLLKVHEDSWFANSAIPNGPATWDAALTAALTATIGELSDKMGQNILRWQYGALHKMSYEHPLGTVRALNSFFNRGPFPVGGDADTVSPSSSSPSNPEKILSGPSYRQIIDLADLSQSLFIIAPGQSGQPASAHYDDLIPLWLEGKYLPMHFDRQKIEAAAENTLHIAPKKT